MRFIRIYTPFICTAVTLVQALMLLYGADGAWTLLCPLADLTGNSLIVDMYFFSVSLRMCRWYKLNIICLILTHVIGIAYNYGYLTDSIYLYLIVCLGSIGIICFLVFRKFYLVR